MVGDALKEINLEPVTAFIIFIIFIIAIFVIACFVDNAQAARINDFRSELEKEFPDAKIHVSHIDSSFLVVDFLGDQIVLGLQKARGTILVQDQPYRSEIPFSGIVKAEVLKDGTQVASTNRGSQVLGAAVGAVALGGIGAIIGGLSGSSTSLNGTKRLSIQITVDDASKPIHEVTFYETPLKKGGRRGEIGFDGATQELAEFGAHLDSAIRKEGELKSLADRLGELWKLKEVGALTQDEFDVQKAKLMNS